MVFSIKKTHPIWNDKETGFRSMKPSRVVSRYFSERITPMVPQPIFAVSHHTLREDLREEQGFVEKLLAAMPGLHLADLFLGEFNTKRFKQLIALPRDILKQLKGFIQITAAKVSGWDTVLYTYVGFATIAAETPGHIFAP